MQKFIKVIVCLSFGIPLVVISSSFIFPFVVPKILLFRSAVLLMLAGYILLLAADWPKYRPRWTLLNIAVACFLASFAVSTIVGADWYKSLWDNHERMLGLFTMFHFVIFYFVLTSAFKKWEDWRLFLRVFLFAGSIVMFLGIVQKFYPDFLLNRGSGRVSATLGNAIYFSGYGLFLFFVGLLLFFKEKAGFWKYWATIGGVLGLWGVFGGGTRGTLLGLIIGFFILLISYLFILKDNKKLRTRIVAILLCCVVLLVAVFAFRHTDFVKNLPAIGRLVGGSFVSDTAGTRLMAWGIALDAWQEKPIFGWGPNNYYYAFNKYYRPEFLELGWGETWFDNAHSAIFNTLSVQGVFGLLTYVGLFLMPLIMLWRGWRKGLADKHLVVVSIAFLIGHFVHNAFVFENPTSYLYFFFFLAFINSQSIDTQILQMHGSQITDQKAKDGSFSLGLSVIVALFVIVLIYFTNINPARANMRALRSIQIAYSNPVAGLELYKKATSVQSPHVDDIRNDFVRTISQVASQLMQANQSQRIVELKNIMEFSYQELQKNFILHPLDIRVHLERSQLGTMLFQLTRDSTYLFETEKDLTEALRISPKRQQIQYMLATIKLLVGKQQEAFGLLRESIENDPKIAEGWWRMAWMYYQVGDNEKARQTVLDAQKSGIEFAGDAAGVVQTIMNDLSKGKDKK